MDFKGSDEKMSLFVFLSLQVCFANPPPSSDGGYAIAKRFDLL